MKIYYAGTPEVPFNKPRAEAEAMIAAGIAFAYVAPAPPARKPDAQFAVHRTTRSKQPFIAASCNSCGSKAQFTGPTAHKTQVFRHCGVTDAVPEHIAEQYAKLRAKWKAPAPQSTEKFPSFELVHF
jgi:hypothetical protein